MLKCLRSRFFRRAAPPVPDRECEYLIYKEAEEITKLGSWVLDMRTNTLWWSRETFRIFEKDASAFAASYEAFLELVHPDDRDMVNQAYQYSVENHRPYEIKHRLLMPDGRIKFVIEKGKTLYDDHGRPTKSVGTVLDVTRLEELEAQVRLARKMESLGLLAGGIAHDFNNLIGVVIGYSSMLMEQTSGHPAIQENVRNILEAARKSAEITAQLLRFSSSKSVDAVVVNVNERLLSLQQLIRQLAREDIAIEYDLARSQGNVLIGLAELDQVVINLVSNAVQAMGNEGGRIRITTRRGTDEMLRERVYLEISDNGCGIEPVDLPRVFEPFFTTRKGGESTGLGLATVFNIVHKAGGTIDVDSTPGEGTRFAVSFPACRDCGVLVSCEECHYEAGHALRIDFKDRTIMLVEDDDMMLNLIESMLLAIGIKVVVFRSPEEAERYYRQEHSSVDAVIADVVMPGINGPRLVERLRAVHPTLRALFVSGYTAHTIRRYGITVDDATLLAKPFSIHSLRDKLSHIFAVAH